MPQDDWMRDAWGENTQDCVSAAVTSCSRRFRVAFKDCSCSSHLKNKSVLFQLISNYNQTNEGGKKITFNWAINYYCFFGGMN